MISIFSSLGFSQVSSAPVNSRWWYLKGHYQGLYQTVDSSKQNSALYRTTILDLTANLNGKNDFPWIAQFAYGHQKDSNLSSEAQLNLKFYEYFAGYSDDSVTTVAGLIEKPFGLSIEERDDFKNWSILKNANDNNDYTQSSGILFRLSQPSYEISLNGFVGHPNELEKFKQKGLSGRLILSINTNWQTGISYLDQKNDYRKITASSLQMSYIRELFWRFDMEISPYKEIIFLDQTSTSGIIYGIKHRYHLGENFFSKLSMQHDQLNLESTKKIKQRISLGIDYEFSERGLIYSNLSSEQTRFSNETESKNPTYKWNFGFKYLLNAATRF